MRRILCTCAIIKTATDVWFEKLLSRIQMETRRKAGTNVHINRYADYRGSGTNATESIKPA